MEDNFINREDTTNPEIDLIDLFLAIWNKKFLISIFVCSAAILSVTYALLLPNIYTSSALLSPSSQNDSLSSKLGGYSSLAGLAGVSLPREAGNKSLEAIARIKSYNFFVNYFLPNINIENLFAVKEWRPEDNTILYNKNIFDEVNNNWIRKSGTPSAQEAYAAFKEILTISEDKTTQFVSLSIEHKSSYIAKRWLDIIIKNINESMREEDKKAATNSINFLNENSKKTNLNEIKEVIAELLQSQMQNLMLASASESYIYKTLDSPIVPERKSSPKRALISILGTLAGGVLGVLMALIQHIRKET